MRLSIIIPTLNEENYIARCIDSAKRFNPIEIIVVDGGSNDKTREIAVSKGAIVIQSQSGRGIQLNSGANVAKGNTLMFLHADSVFEDNISPEVLDLQDHVAGFFRLRFDDQSISTRVVELFANLRARWFSLPYGDQALFVKREVFQAVRGFKNFPFLEDLDLVLRLRKIGRLKALSQKVIVSPRRIKKGYPLSPIFISLRNTLLALLFRLGISPQRLLSMYK